jgi:hypothetical protein
MTVTNRIQNGKIIESEIPKVLRLINHYLEAFHYNYLRCKNDDEMLVCENNNDMGSEMLLQKAKACALSRQLLYEYAFDLYEFFYLKREPELGEYFCYQLPLDIEKYEKERVPEEKINELLKDKNNLNVEIVNCIRQTADTFYKYLNYKE